MDIFGALGELLHYLGDWIPRPRSVRINERGLRFWFGKWVREVQPGWRLEWPALAELDVVSVARDVVDLPAQTLLTRDQREVLAAGIVALEIVDLRKYLIDNHDAERAIVEAASAALRDAIVAKTLDEIQETDGRRAIDKKLTSCATEELADFGVKVRYMRLTDFSTARAINCIGTGTSVLPEIEEDE